MKLLILLMALSLSYAQYAAKCKKPVPQNNFSMRRLSGAWFLAAYEPKNPQEAELYAKSRCGVGYLHLDQGYHKRDKFELDLIFGQTHGGLFGSYTVPNNTLGFLQIFYTAGNFTYDYTVTCTDYQTLAVVYVCAEVSPQFTSEFLLFFVRNIKTYAKLPTSFLANRCFQNTTTKPVRSWQQMPFYDCPDVI